MKGMVNIMKLSFTKMHGCGNDYVYINGEEYNITNKKDLAIRLSDRHFGIGGDGIIFINPSTRVDFEMEMYNADGSRAEMCGNGIRSVAKYVYDKKMTSKKELKIESAGSIKTIWLTTENDKVKAVKVNMGSPIFKPEQIPVLLDQTKVAIQEELIEADGKKYRFTAVSMGNPHAVIQVDDPMEIEIDKIGPLMEHHPYFPKRINTEFIKVVDRENITMRVWERGSGETLACGTGACAVAAACILNGLTENKVTVKLLGGSLMIEWDREQDQIFMTGPAETVFEGTIEI